MSPELHMPVPLPPPPINGHTDDETGMESQILPPDLYQAHSPMEFTSRDSFHRDSHIYTIASYNVFSVVLVFSMLSLGRILISDLVVANLLMYSLRGMILLYLATPFFILKVFLDEISSLL